MINRRKISSPGIHTVHTANFETLPVSGGLAVTPAQMMDLTSRGIAVSSANNLMFSEGVSNPSMDLPIDRVRGVDANDVWNAEKSSKKRLLNAVKNHSITNPGS